MARLKKSLLIIILASLSGLFLTYFIVRNSIVANLVHEKIEKFNENHVIQVSYSDVRMAGIKTLYFDSLFLSSGSPDTIMFSGSISANINITQLISGHIRFRKLKLSNTAFYLNDSIFINYDRFLSHNTDKKTTNSAEVNYYKKVETILRRVFQSIPSKIIVNNFSLEYQKDTINLNASLDKFTLKRGRFYTELNVNENTIHQKLKIEGKIKPARKLIQVNISPANGKNTVRAPIAKLFGVDFLYDNLELSFSEISNKGKISKLKGELNLSKCKVYHPSLSSKSVSFPGSSMNFNLSVGSDFITLDSISEISLGSLSLHPYINYTKSQAQTLELSCFVPTFTAKSFFESIPEDLFSQLKAVEAEGSLSYRGHLFVDFALPDSLKLESNLYNNKFKITRFNDGIKKMNHPFVHSVYEKGVLKRQIDVSPSNPDFRPLSEIPKLLQTTILFAEDDAFFYSNGFSLNAMQRAIAEDIKEKRFARGGSTISMQLIKNIYLSREKTFSRKLEEIILVWLIESNRIVTKGRMFEVYLNIIEWGPNVYGASEASRFYFSKDISQLNATECIFLASVIPSPKKFYYRFDKQGSIAQFEKDYYVQMSERLAKWGHIPSANADSLMSALTITGPARIYIENRISVADTTTSTEDFEEEFPETLD